MITLALIAQLLASMPDAGHLARKADSAGLPRLAVLALAWEETRWNTRPHVRGLVGEWGRFQIRTVTARARCSGINIRTYRGNVECFFKMFGEDVRRFGIERAICVHNTGRPMPRCDYSTRVLATWKREELQQPQQRSTLES